MSTASMTALRRPSLDSLGLGGVLDIFRHGRLPAQAADLVEEVFGADAAGGGIGDGIGIKAPRAARDARAAGRKLGSLVISGSSGMVGAGKAMQLGSRLQRYGVRVVGLDFHGAPDGIRGHYPGLVESFGREEADRVMANIVRLSYDGRSLPAELADLQPRFLLEAIPEMLELKKAHYAMFRSAFPGIEIRSVTSGFPSSQLGVGVAHPAFPHHINKVWEIVEPAPSASTRLLWALGLVPVPVGDHWSFVLDVLFCGLTHAAIGHSRRTNMPFWKADKWVRQLLGPNPFRAHDAIGAKGSNFLTWSCLHHLGLVYGDLFAPTPELVERKTTGQDWYPPNHFRPLVDWKLDAEEEEELRVALLGPLMQMTSLLLHEQRASLPHINAVGELCAQFRRGTLAVARDMGPEKVIRTVEAFHRVCPGAAKGPTPSWHPEAFEAMGSPEWQQLYVNAEHDGRVGVITLGRESYNADVDRELNRAIDWLRKEGIERVILTGDFHLATQLVGADTRDFHPALESEEYGRKISCDWSATARRLAREFRVSVGFVHGKRCMGGCLELLLHCRYLVAREDALLGMPEVTLPVVPGMEGCHWPFRRAPSSTWPRLVRLLLGGTPVPAREATGWLVDYAGPMETALGVAWRIAGGGEHAVIERSLVETALPALPELDGELPAAGDAGTEAARQAIARCIRDACGTSLSEAVLVQARHSAEFMRSSHCFNGRIGADYRKTLQM